MQNYMKKLLEELEIEPGLFFVEVQHDTDCQFWTTRVCTCDPDLVVTKDMETSQ